MKNQFIVLYLFLVFIAGNQAAGQQIKSFNIECDPGDFQYMYENYTEDIYIPVVLTFEGMTWQEVRLRIRGDSSREDPKKSLKAYFDSDPFVTGEDVLNFNADYQDRSYMRSFLSSLVFNEAGIACTAIEHVLLYLNSEFFGIYLMTQNVDAAFLQSHGFTAAGNLYKASLDGACMSIFDNIFYHWEKKLDNTPDRQDLAELIHSLNYTGDESFKGFLSSAFDYDRLLTVIALNMLVANGSTYYHNYFLYHETGTAGKWFVFPWDLDRTYSTYSKWYPFYSSSGSWTPDNPLLERSLIDDQVFEDIQGTVLDLTFSIFNENQLFPVIDSLHNVLLPYIPLDTTDQVENLPMWEAYVEANRDFISDRYNQLDYQFHKYPENFQLHRKGGYYLPNEPIQFSWNPSSDPNGLEVFYNLYISMDPDFEDTTTQSVQGLSDNFFIYTGFENTGKYYWKVEASNYAVSLPGFDTYNHIFIAQDIPHVVINEINYNSAPDFDTEDWVELYNPTENQVDITGWIFMDEDNGHKFFFPEGSVLAPHGCIVLCRDTSMFFDHFPDTIYVAGNMDFGLKNTGEFVRLYHPTGYLVDSLVFGIDFPWPATPNGNGPTLELINPGLDNALAESWDASAAYGTPGKQNSVYSPGSVGKLMSYPVSLSVNPNPFHSSTDVCMEISEPSEILVKVIDQMGIIVEEKRLRQALPGMQIMPLNAEPFPIGIYYISVYANNKYSGSVKVIKSGD